MSIAEKIIAVVAPHYCIACNREGILLCERCIEGLRKPLYEQCYSCLKPSKDNRTCSTCHKQSRLQSVWAISHYEGVSRELVARLKFGRAAAAARIMAESIARTLPGISADYVIVPVPTAQSRVRERGYDQAVLIAKELSSILDIPMQQLLIRLGDSRQVGASRTERLTQLKRGFIAKADRRFYKVLLVDDVLTTGGTLESAARALKMAGVRTVSAAVFARA